MESYAKGTRDIWQKSTLNSLYGDILEGFNEVYLHIIRGSFNHSYEIFQLVRMEYGFFTLVSISFLVIMYSAGSALEMDGYDYRSGEGFSDDTYL